jgi:hypothetical protein
MFPRRKNFIDTYFPNEERDKEWQINFETAFVSAFTAHYLRAGALCEKAKDELQKAFIEVESYMSREEKTPEMRRYRQSRDVQALYTAAALQYHEPDTNIVLHLIQRLKYVFAVQDAFILVLSDEEGKTASAYRLPFHDDPEFSIKMQRFVKQAHRNFKAVEYDRATFKDDPEIIPYLERFVKSVYDGNTKDKFAAFGESLLTALMIKKS